MSRLNSFFLPPAEWRDPFILTGEEARHLLKVLRLGPGAQVRLFDGRGREGLFVVEATTKRDASLRPEAITETPRPAGELWLALGWNKSTRRGWLLEKSVELGAGGLIFWQAARSQGDMPAEPKETWHAQMIAGAKQSENPWLPELRMVQGGVAGLLEAAGEFDRTLLLWESAGQGSSLGTEDLRFTGSTLVIIGPEGGLTAGEAEACQRAGVRPVSLGDRVLRWETAAMVSLGLFWWGRQPMSAPQAG